MQKAAVMAVPLLENMRYRGGYRSCSLSGDVQAFPEMVGDVAIIEHW